MTPSEGPALVVVIEDEGPIQAGMRALLQHWGYEVVTAVSADAAIGSIRSRRRRPRLVIADYHLEDGRLGTEAIAAMQRAFGQDLPGVVITAMRTPDVRERIAAAGLPVVGKPVRPAQLRSVIRHVLHRSAA